MDSTQVVKTLLSQKQDQSTMEVVVPLNHGTYIRALYMQALFNPPTFLWVVYDPDFRIFMRVTTRTPVCLVPIDSVEYPEDSVPYIYP